MNRKHICWIGFLVVAFLVIGQMTEFRFRDIDIQLHDSYYVVPSWLALVIVLTILELLRGFVIIVDRLSDRSRLMAITISIINGLLGLVLIVLIYVAILNLIQVKVWYPELEISNYIGIITLLFLFLLLLIIIEIKTVKKVWIKKEL